MKFLKSIAAAFVLGAVSIGSATPASAQTSIALEQAEAIRKLDIMLMVTSLRCRAGVHDFQADYYRFAATHLDELNAASRQLHRSLAARHGHVDGRRALDRLGVTMANSYGGGHPWLDCAGLKQVARELSDAPDSSGLPEAAIRLLSAEPIPQMAADSPDVPVLATLVQAERSSSKLKPGDARIAYDFRDRGRGSLANFE
ncbi:MAG: S-adenosyl-L-homocysteine hydrolase [Pseudomonadota bacterium]